MLTNRASQLRNTRRSLKHLQGFWQYNFFNEGFFSIWNWRTFGCKKSSAWTSIRLNTTVLDDAELQHNSKKKCNAEKLLRPQNICNKSAEKIDCSQLKQKKMNNSLFFQSILTRRRIFFLLVVVTEWWPKIILLFHDSSNSLHLLENPANRTKIWSSSFIYLLRGTNKLFTRVLCQTLTHSLKLSPLISPLSLFPCSLSDRERESSVRVCVRVYGRQSVRERERERESSVRVRVCV